MSDTAKKIVTVLEPEDEYTHEPDAAENYNESMYLNAFDAAQEVGGWFRIGNRVNEGYAEMTVCVYLPGGRVGFVYGRPQIETNEKMEAGGLAIEVVEPDRAAAAGRVHETAIADIDAHMGDPAAGAEEDQIGGGQSHQHFVSMPVHRDALPVHLNDAGPGEEPEGDAQQRMQRCQQEQRAKAIAEQQVHPGFTHARILHAGGQWTDESVLCKCVSF